MHLRPTGHAGFHRRPLRVKGNQLVQPRRELGPVRIRTDDRHFAAQHIPELGQCVQPQVAQEFTGLVALPSWRIQRNRYMVNGTPFLAQRAFRAKARALAKPSSPESR